jgi:simple sugar transport system ATP-binding protein
MSEQSSSGGRRRAEPSTAETESGRAVEGHTDTPGTTEGVATGPAANAPALPNRGETIIEVNAIGKSYGSVIALRDVTTSVRAGEVTCVLGDNGAGKSTFIKILAGAHEHTSGSFVVDGVKRQFSSPRAALALGIATVYQDLAVVPLMPVWRNFFLGSELTKGWGPLRRLDMKTMRRITKTELEAMGIDLRDVEQPIGTLSGGERQCVAIARAVYFGARVLILDEPTAALGVKESAQVLRLVEQLRERDLGVILISHNMPHVWEVADRIHVQRLGRCAGVITPESHTMTDGVAIMTGAMALS